MTEQNKEASSWTDMARRAPWVRHIVAGRPRWPRAVPIRAHNTRYTASLVNAVKAVLLSRDVYLDPTFTVFRAGQNDCNFGATVAQRGWENLE